MVLALDTIQTPDHIQKRRNANIGGVNEAMSGGLGESLPRISIKGNRFRRVIGGEELLHPEVHLDVVIVGSSDGVGRMFFDTAYDPDASENASPACWSDDGELPSSSAPRTPTGVSACASCPMNEKGSGADGKSRNCGFLKNLAVVVPEAKDGQIYTLKAGGQTIFAPSTTPNFYNIQDFGAKLASIGTGLDVSEVMTRVQFDAGSSTPQLVFGVAAVLSEEHIALIDETRRAQAVEIEKHVTIASGTTPSGATAKTDAVAATAAPAQIETAPEPTPEPAAAAPEPTPEPAAAPVADTAAASLDSLIGATGAAPETQAAPAAATVEETAAPAATETPVASSAAALDDLLSKLPGA